MTGFIDVRNNAVSELPCDFLQWKALGLISAVRFYKLQIGEKKGPDLWEKKHNTKDGDEACDCEYKVVFPPYSRKCCWSRAEKYKRCYKEAACRNRHSLCSNMGWEDLRHVNICCAVNKKCITFQYY